MIPNQLSSPSTLAHVSALDNSLPTTRRVLFLFNEEVPALTPSLQASFFLVRLLQNFSEISLALDAVPPEHRPRDEWKDGGEGFHSGQKVWARAHITMYASVCVVPFRFSVRQDSDVPCLGWTVGEHEGGLLLG